ncbi:MAG: hypothetical protein H7068_04580 [Pedobacter sp.]|nr:hypothetical protein [Chitinophagaceae bacterium]
MKHIKYLIILLLISLTALGQSEKNFWFKEVNWKITLPNNFTLVDSTVDAKNAEIGSRMLEKAGGKKPDNSKSKTLISAVKGQIANFNIIISKSIAPNLRYWDSTNNNVIKIFYKSIFNESPSSKFDTVRTKRIIDGLDFKEFQMHIKLNDIVSVHNFYLSRLYDGYTISVNYFYIDEITGEEIKKSLDCSKFLPTLIGTIND